MFFYHMPRQAHTSSAFDPNKFGQIWEYEREFLKANENGRDIFYEVQQSDWTSGIRLKAGTRINRKTWIDKGMAPFAVELNNARKKEIDKCLFDFTRFKHYIIEKHFQGDLSRTPVGVSHAMTYIEMYQTNYMELHHQNSSMMLWRQGICNAGDYQPAHKTFLAIGHMDTVAKKKQKEKERKKRVQVQKAQAEAANRAAASAECGAVSKAPQPPWRPSRAQCNKRDGASQSACQRTYASDPHGSVALQIPLQIHDGQPTEPTAKKGRKGEYQQ